MHSPGSVLSGSAVGGWQSQASGSVVALASVAPVAPATDLQSNLTNAAGWLFSSKSEHAAFNPHEDEEEEELR